MLDSAALFLALAPKAPPVIPARLCLRAGFQCFNRIAQAMGIDVPDEPDPAAGITLTYAEFLDAVARMREVDFPIERDPAEAWPDFAGWRVNYERPAHVATGSGHWRGRCRGRTDMRTMAVSAAQGRAAGADNPRISIPDTKVTGTVTPKTTLRTRSSTPRTRNMSCHRVRAVRANRMRPITDRRP